jgi:hypothetical protein
MSVAAAQNMQVSGFADGYSVLNSVWRFQTGDDPGWASAGFDDSQWRLIRLDRSWAQQGYGDYSGFAWYRLRVTLPARSRSLAMLFDSPATSAEVFADGQLIGTIGQMRPTPRWRGIEPAPQILPLPPESTGRPLEIALRVWQSRLFASSSGAGVAALPRIGTIEAIAALHSLALRTYLNAQVPELLLDTVAVVIGLFSLGLFFFRPQAAEYLWCALWMVSEPGYSILHMVRGFMHWPIPLSAFIFDSILSFGAACWLLFIWGFVGSQKDWRLKTGIALNFVTPLTIVLAMSGVLSVAATYIASGLVTVTLGILILMYLLRRALGGNRNAQMFLVPFLLYSGMNAIRDSIGALYFVGLARAPEPVAYRASAFNLTWEEIFDLLAYLAVAAVLALRFTRSAREEQRLSTELESAHQVQAQLVPASLPSTPQFSFDASYIAASEVGGDFYQVLPSADGSLLVAIGDVSGKGLKAAMFGVLVVGALRSLAQENLSPAQTLNRMNVVLADSAHGGFVTCVLLRFSANGQVSAANAGHLPPYCNAQEIEVISGLPLGIFRECEYLETAFALVPGQTLTLLSDGIPEAQDRHGQLLGFDRTRELSTEPASAIAEAARHFGQQDDITILKITFSPAEPTTRPPIMEPEGVTPIPLP